MTREKWNINKQDNEGMTRIRKTENLRSHYVDLQGWRQIRTLRSILPNINILFSLNLSTIPEKINKKLFVVKTDQTPPYSWVVWGEE